MDYRVALECAVECARSAGRLLLEEARRPGGPRGWGAHAEADIEAEALIQGRLARGFPSWGYHGEELGLLKRPSEDGHLWLVDPNDATAAFLRGLRGPSVSIALVRGGIPVLGAVFAYTAPDDFGDLICWAEGCGPLRRNQHPVERHWPRTVSGSTVLLTAVRDSAAESRRHQALASPMQVRQTPSIAYRLALVAAGEADAAMSATHLKSWDYAAGHALLRAAGGVLCGAGGAEISYRDDGTSDTGGRLFGGSAALVREVARRWP